MDYYCQSARHLHSLVRLSRVFHEMQFLREAVSSAVHCQPRIPQSSSMTRSSLMLLSYQRFDPSRLPAWRLIVCCAMSAEEPKFRSRPHTCILGVSAPLGTVLLHGMAVMHDGVINESHLWAPHLRALSALSHGNRMIEFRS
jgi:hypothetical protein